jgi:exopolyphosphatase / guanosine-5'-triphosphate,3'-diphosphate pyrophosphatase
MDRSEPGIDATGSSYGATSGGDCAFDAGGLRILRQPVAPAPQPVEVRPRQGPVYAALDLGTNNCRLLLARRPLPGQDPGAFRIIDSFCRIVRLGEGVSREGRLAETAIARTIAALRICREKMRARHVSRARLVATEACRAAANSGEFLERVHAATGLTLEIVDRETEAMLATAGCASLADPEADGVVLFDIGGGSSEIVWLGAAGGRPGNGEDALRARVRAWDSMKLGVVSLAEKFGGKIVTPEIYEAMVAYVLDALAPFAAQVAKAPRGARFHLLGTSGTVTTIAGVHLGLPRYDRRRVDGLWMSEAEIATTVAVLRGMSYEERMMNGCIGSDRADLVLAGCAIFEAIRRTFPAERVRIADRGLREGILMQLMAADRMWSHDGY